MRNTSSAKEALRLHSFYCAGCSEYGGHSVGASGKTDSTVTLGTDSDQNAGFDSPPPPSMTGHLEHTHDRNCLRGNDYHFDNPHVHNADCYDC